ncbi:hypothetical protein E0500_005465 [Streptomyces sp. KM273126]|nr:hypothetical protein [Streptomyces sp. KM273126]MBA2806907.1 hypothetical protein [Streptomyces sp. KM273126]
MRLRIRERGRLSYEAAWRLARVMRHPGVTVNPVDNSYGDFDLLADHRRR